MPLPNPEKARKILSSFEDERRLEQESEKVRKKKEAVLRKKSKQEIQTLLMSAIKIAYEGRSFFTIYRNEIPEIQDLIEEGLEQLGFDVYQVAAGIKHIEWKIKEIDKDRFNPVLKQYEEDLYKLEQHINSWLSVRFNRDGSYPKVSSQLIPLIFDPVRITGNANNWPRIMQSLDSWCAISESDEPGTYLLASLAFDDKGFDKALKITDMVLNPARESALAAHAKHLRKIAIELRSIQKNSYGKLKNTLELLHSLDKSLTLLSWIKPPGKVQVHGKITAWILSWISNEEGKEFLDEFSDEIESLAKLGIKELNLGKSIFQLEKVGLINEDLFTLLTSLEFEVFESNDGMVVRWS
jgi:hypothetical protein